MQAKIFCMASAKGGSGKTSLTATLGKFLSKLQKKVLLIDADSSTNGLTLLYLKEVKVKSELVHSVYKKPSGLFQELVSDKEEFTNSSCDVVELDEFLHLIPASYSLQEIEIRVTDSIQSKLFCMLRELRDQYDFIFIDAQAGIDDMARLAMNRKISDEVVIVSEFDPMSAAGVERLKSLLREDLTYDRTWVLLNKILPEFAKSFSDFLEVAKYLPPVPWNAEVVRAYARRQLAIDTDTGTEHTLSIIEVLKGMCGELISESLSNWVESRVAMIRQPLEQQYSDAEKEMKFLLEHRSKIDRKTILLEPLIALPFMVAGISVLAYAIYTAVFKLKLLEFFGIDSTLPEKAGFLIVLIATGIVSVVFMFNSNVFRIISELVGFINIDKQISEERIERQLELLKEKLKHLEMLRTLDSESLLKKRDPLGW